MKFSRGSVNFILSTKKGLPVIPFAEDKSAASRNTFQPVLFTYIPPAGPRVYSFPAPVTRTRSLVFQEVGHPPRCTCPTPRHRGKCNYADGLNYRSASAIVAGGNRAGDVGIGTPARRAAVFPVPGIDPIAGWLVESLTPPSSQRPPPPRRLPVQLSFEREDRNY